MKFQYLAAAAQNEKDVMWMGLSFRDRIFLGPL